MRDLRLYFAYGSNLAPSRLEERKINAKFLGIGYVNHYKFMLNKSSKKDPSIGFANIVPCWNKRVFGALYDLGNIGAPATSESELSSNPQISNIIAENVHILDKFEGYPDHYERTTIGVNIDWNGKSRRLLGFTYMASIEKQSATNLFVKEDYIGKINEGLDFYPEPTNESMRFAFDTYKTEVKQLMELWKDPESKI